MGGKSSSSSASTTKTTTENFDQRLTVGNDGFGVAAYDGSSIEVTDLGVVAAAENLLRESFAGAEAIIDDVTGLAKANITAVNSILAENVESDTKELASLMVKVGAVLAIAVVFITMRKK